MNKLPQIARLNESNIPGLDLVRLIDVNDVDWLMGAEEVWRGASPGVLPVGGFVPKTGETWVDFFFAPGTSSYNETMLKNVQGESWKHQIMMPIAFDSPRRAEAIRILSRGRWLALVMDGNEVVRLVGTKAQPLKLVSSVKGSNGRNIELQCETYAQAYYLEGWEPDEIYGNPADFSFEFWKEYNS